MDLACSWQATLHYLHAAGDDTPRKCMGLGTEMHSLPLAGGILRACFGVGIDRHSLHLAGGATLLTRARYLARVYGCSYRQT